MEKVKVSKEVFVALEKYKRLSGNNLGELVSDRVVNMTYKYDSYKPLEKLTVKDACDILLNGYELEETPKEKVLRHYKWLNDIENLNVYDNGYIQGMKTTLDLLEIKIKGINE